MYYTGIDLHRKKSFLTTVDEKGRVVKRDELLNDEELIRDYFDRLDGDPKVVIESTANWFWLYDLLTGQGLCVSVSNPARTKAIGSAKIKNDKIDSHMLAQLLRADMIPASHVSTLETRQLKELLRHRAKLVQDVVRMKNRIHNILAKNNHTPPVTDLFGVKGRAYLEQIALPDYFRSHLETYLALYGTLKEQVEDLTRSVREQAKDDPAAKLLVTIPGVGPLTAMCFVAEIEDISRFPSARHLASYAGLVPSLSSSAGKDHRGRITKQGSVHLRTALVEAAQAAARVKNCKINLFFRRIIVRAGYRKAVVATARKILQCAYYMLKNNEPYREESSAPA